MKYSEHLYNTITGTQFYPDCAVKKEEILDFLQPEDVEEVVSLYLQLEKAISSTPVQISWVRKPMNLLP